MRGNLDFVLETVEQLAWLASALRPSPVGEGVMACHPTLTRVGVSKDKEKQTARYGMAISCQMVFEFARQPDENDAAETSAGFCWFGLFRNPILVTGYLTPRRIKACTGLEIPLSFLSLLVDSTAIFKVDDNIMLKGFSSLLVVVKATSDLVMWHLLFNPTGERMSFFDARAESIEKTDTRALSLKDLESRRHCVGWCRHVKEYSGKKNSSNSFWPSTDKLK